MKNIQICNTPLNELEIARHLLNSDFFPKRSLKMQNGNLTETIFSFKKEFGGDSFSHIAGGSGSAGGCGGSGGCGGGGGCKGGSGGSGGSGGNAVTSGGNAVTSGGENERSKQ
ncbi:hypothetical protein [Pseudomonas sp. PDM25]|uniref:hypothetical protein n=2 Tax=unclassified Pseudomonas TaxID=196821 RepID=UPI001C436AC4|nr:hypothetical protein [Pseudomonas sp. PDM25]MBV7509917.1 hypothetical protein [Pseudomonas sp. PDM25]